MITRKVNTFLLFNAWCVVCLEHQGLKMTLSSTGGNHDDLRRHGLLSDDNLLWFEAAALANEGE